MREAAQTKKIHREINFGGTGLTQRALFAKNLAVMIAAGLTIIEALRVAAESAGGKLKNIILSLTDNYFKIADFG
jgi:type II secretory pathway component PulF